MLRHVVERLVERNDRVWSSDEGALAAASGEGEEKGMAAFRGVRVPRMGVGEYVERIGRYAGAAMSPSCFVVAFVLLDRAAHRRPAHPVGSRTVHRLLLTSLLLASKLLDDANAELNRLELELLFLLDFELTVTPRVYESYYFHLQKEMLASGTNKHKITRSPITRNGTIDADGDFETNKQKTTRFPMTNGAIDEDGDFESSADGRPRRWSLSPPRRSIDCC
ncbi:Cyclin-P1-1 [Ananas comosus]|uniref:Cyclin-P1-1 n=1 Tax=Ananas comosus TaxID=4615 RepID=A0A199VRD7_ANACO|nr:Cyclin-P1-1 [Ananas comosus]